MLHSFYTGVEGILISIVKQIDEVPHGARWHRDLLDRALVATDRRPAILTQAVRDSLNGYLAFRHFFRQAYSFVLRWGDMQELVSGLEPVWDNVRRDLETWLEAANVPE